MLRTELEYTIYQDKFSGVKFYTTEFNIKKQFITMCFNFILKSMLRLLAGDDLNQNIKSLAKIYFNLIKSKA